MSRKRFFCLCLILSIVFCSTVAILFSPAAAVAAPSDEWYDRCCYADAASGVFSGFWLSQTFIPATSHSFNIVSFPLYKKGSPTYAVTISLFAGSTDNTPTGTALATTTFLASSLTTTPTWYTYQFSTGYQVVAGTKYALVLSADSGNLDNLVYAGVNTHAWLLFGYRRGMRGFCADAGGTWTTKPTQDMAFLEGQRVTWYEQYATGCDVASGVYNGFWPAQTFTPATSHTLNTVSLRLYKVGSPTYTVTIGLHAAGSDDKPTGPALASTTFLASSLTTSPMWYTYQFSTGYAVAAGTKYALVFSATDGASGTMVYWRVDAAGTYSGGMKAASADQGLTWTTNSVQDFMFKEGQI
jgi:hypothetical protein